MLFYSISVIMTLIVGAVVRCFVLYKEIGRKEWGVDWLDRFDQNYLFAPCLYCVHFRIMPLTVKKGNEQRKIYVQVKGDYAFSFIGGRSVKQSELHRPPLPRSVFIPCKILPRGCIRRANTRDHTASFFSPSETRYCL